MSVKDNALSEEYWIKRYEDKDTVWQLKKVNPHLLEHRDFVLFKASPRVFVPCCGKSKDMKWFYDQGCYVVGVDCASQALKEFFEENDMTFSMKDLNGDTQVFSSEDGRIQLFCCNLFRFHEVSDERNFDVVWDRGSLGSVPPLSERKQFFDLMASLLAPDFRYLLHTFEYDPSLFGGPPKAFSDKQLEDVVGGRFKMEIASKTDYDLQRHGIPVKESKSVITLITPL